MENGNEKKAVVEIVRTKKIRKIKKWAAKVEIRIVKKASKTERWADKDVKLKKDSNKKRVVETKINVELNLESKTDSKTKIIGEV